MSIYPCSASYGRRIRCRSVVAGVFSALIVSCGWPAAAEKAGPPATAVAAETAERSNERELAKALDAVKRGVAARREGIALLRSGRHQRAIAAFNAALKIDPLDTQALLGRARAHGALGRTERAFGDLDAMLKLNPNSVAGHLERAKLLRWERRHDEALVDLEAAVALQPGMITPRFAKAETHLALGQREQADRELDVIGGLSLNAGGMFMLRATLPLRAGDYATALWYLDKALEHGQPTAELHKLRGTVLAEQGRHEDALRSFDKALALAPEDAGTVFLRGSMHMMLGQRDRALDDFGQALTLRPDFPEARELQRRLESGRRPGERAT